MYNAGIVLLIRLFVSADKLSIGLAVGLTLLAGVVISIFLFVMNRRRRM